MPDRELSYVFPPLERRGLLLGLQAVQLLTLAAGVVVAAALHALLPSFLGVAAGVITFGASAALALWSRDGAPLCAWAVTATSFVLRGSRRVRLSGAPLRGWRPGCTLDQTAPPGIELLEEHDPLGGAVLGIVRDRAAG